MENNLLNIKLGENNTIKSIDLVEIINEFREIEKEKGFNGKMQKPLKHKNFMAKIRKEVEILENAGLNGVVNFKPSSYLNKQGKKQPCFELTRDGMLQMLNSESTLVRYKTIELINKLENDNVSLKEDNKKIYGIATSDDDLKKRQYEADKIKYAFRNIPSILEDCTYANLEQEVKKIIDVHTHLKPKDRYEYHQRLNKTEYKQKVRKQISVKLEQMMAEKDSLFITVAHKLNTDLHKKLLSTTKKSTSHIISNQKKEIDEYKEYINYNEPDDYITVNCHPFTENSIYGSVKFGNKLVFSPAYVKWRKKFPFEDLPEDPGVDFSKPVGIWMYFDHLEKFDVINFSKSFIDMIGLKYGVDDSNVNIMRCMTNNFVDDYSEGKIYYAIKNI